MKLLLILFTSTFMLTGCITAIPVNNDQDQTSSQPEATPHRETEKHQPPPVEKVTYQSDNQEQGQWSYDRNGGPGEWSELSPKYKLCSQGTRQSPIDITKTVKANLGRITFRYKSGPKEIINNGNTIQVNMHKGSSIVVSGKTYNLLQFHFHSPSEHMIDGKPADMVAHFVHQARDGQIAVVAVLMDGCQESRTLSQMWRKLPGDTGKKIKLSRKIKVTGLLPNNRDYYRYSGSLTTPPCTEDVNWFILKNPITVSSAQIKSFTEIFSKSVRPLQEKNYRVVKRN